MDFAHSGEGLLIIGIIFGVALAALVAFVILCLYYPGCGLRCRCFAQSSRWDDYEQIIGIDENFGQDLCVICREELKISDTLYRAPCRHKFHKKCLKQWLKQNNRCPLCDDRMQLTPIPEASLSRGE